MKLTCHRAMLTDAFQTVSAVVPTRTPREILRNVKLVIADGQATLMGTDQEVGIRYSLPEVESDSAGELLLPTQRVSQILRECQDDSIQIELTDEALMVRTSRSEYRLSIEDPAEFPSVTTFDDDNYYVVPGKALQTLIHRTVFATDVESTRYALGGVLTELSPETITLAATDSRRLAVTSGQCTAHGDVGSDTQSPVVPAKAMQLIDRSISGNDEDVQIAVHDNDILVKSGPSTIYARLVEGRFPKYQDVIPQDFTSTIELVAAPFHSCIRQAQIVTNEESRGVDFTFSEGLLTLSSKAADVGQSKVEHPISYDGDEMTITFDPKFVADFLKVLPPEQQVHLNLINAETAAVFTTEGNYTYVVMPLAREGR